ncbi:hypothetical protein LINPERHAP1_LOCUS44288, partial [Linum perenne]
MVENEFLCCQPKKGNYHVARPVLPCAPLGCLVDIVVA